MFDTSNQSIRAPPFGESKKKTEGLVSDGSLDWKILSIIYVETFPPSWQKMKSFP